MASKRGRLLDLEASMSEPAKRTKVVVDPYCWLCHKDGTKINCSRCIRSYHSECIGFKPKSDEDYDYMCKTCIKMDEATTDYAKRKKDVEFLNSLLMYVTKRLFDDVEFQHFINYFEKNQEKVKSKGIVNVFGLAETKRKVQSAGYKTALEHLNDIRWIRHNGIIIAPDNQRILKRLEQFCSKEVYDIEMCDQCFDHSNTKENWFAELCDPPHFLVWARESGHYPFKPAKVIGTTSESKVDIRFFGDHDKVIISPTNCYLYSRQNPNQRSDDKTLVELIKSNEEVDMYMKNINDKYGAILLISEPKIAFNVKKIARYLTAMIPTLQLPTDYSLPRKPNYLGIRKSVSKPQQSSIQWPAYKLCELKIVLDRAENDPMLRKYLQKMDYAVDQGEDHDFETEQQSDFENSSITTADLSETDSNDVKTEATDTNEQLIDICIEPVSMSDFEMDDIALDNITEEINQTATISTTLEELPADEIATVMVDQNHEQQDKALREVSAEAIAPTLGDIGQNDEQHQDDASTSIERGYELEPPPAGENVIKPLAQSTPSTHRMKGVASTPNEDRPTAETLIVENNDMDKTITPNEIDAITPNEADQAEETVIVERNHSMDLQAKLNELEHRNAELDAELNALKAQLARSALANEAKKAEIEQLKADKAAKLKADIEKAIEETKKKIWCTICQNEVKAFDSFNVANHVCSQECLITLWKKTHEPASNNLEQQPIDQDVRNMTQKWIEQVQNSQPLTPDSVLDDNHLENVLGDY